MAILDGDAGNNVIYGTSVADTITGKGGSDSLTGNGGDDTIYGDSSTFISTETAGGDTIYASGGNDYVIGGGGSDTIYGSMGDDVIYGGYTSYNSYATDTLLGEDGNDSLHGNTGNNNFYGGNGNDDIFDKGAAATVNGGEGDDYFYHNSVSGVGGISTITDSGTTYEDVVIIVQAATGNDLFPEIKGSDLHVRTVADNSSGTFTRDAVIKDYLTSGIDFVVAANGDPLIF